MHFSIAAYGTKGPNFLWEEQSKNSEQSKILSA